MSFFHEPRPEDVTNRVLEDFPADETAEVLEILKGITGFREEGPWSATWLQFACLRLTSGRKDLLPQWVQLANQDARDLQLFVERLHGGDWLREYILYRRRT